MVSLENRFSLSSLPRDATTRSKKPIADSPFSFSPLRTVLGSSIISSPSPRYLIPSPSPFSIFSSRINFISRSAQLARLVRCMLQFLLASHPFPSFHPMTHLCSLLYYAYDTSFKKTIYKLNTDGSLFCNAQSIHPRFRLSLSLLFSLLSSSLFTPNLYAFVVFRPSVRSLCFFPFLFFRSSRSTSTLSIRHFGFVRSVRSAFLFEDNHFPDLHALRRTKRVGPGRRA